MHAGQILGAALEHLKLRHISMYSYDVVKSVRVLIKALEVKHDVAVITEDSVLQYFTNVKNEARFNCDEKLLESLSRINTYYLESQTTGLDIDTADNLFKEVKAASSFLLKIIDE
jgi:hypothetical protein